MIWKLDELVDHCRNEHAKINGKWVPCRPENGKKKYASICNRVKAAWAVFTCKAEAFTWPEGQ